MPCYLSVHDREFRIIDGNQRFRQDFGERVGEFCYRVYKGRDEVCDNCPVAATFADGVSHAQRADAASTCRGEQVPVMVHTTPVRNDARRGGRGDGDAHRHPRAVKQLQDQLRRSQERLAQLFEEVPCYISVQGAGPR